MTTNTKLSDVLVPQECGCVQQWMPEMEDLLGTNRCTTHQSQYDETTKDAVVYDATDLTRLILHATTHDSNMPVMLVKNQITGDWIEDPNCPCGLPR